VARLIDLAIFVLILILGMFVGDMANWFTNSGISTVIVVIIYASLFVFYDLIFEIFMNGQSVGKRIMKIKVISLDGGQPRVGQYFMRWLFRIVDFLLTWPGLVALIAAAVNEKTQRVGDMVAGTILIRTKPRTQINNIVFMPMYDGYQPVFKEAGQLNDKDIELIHEIIGAYMKSGNNVVVYNMAQRVKEHLSVVPPNGMNDMLFLQTIIKDYNHISAQMDNL
jgi:uncharacterized RDD family membrane protein YckC